MKAADLGLPLRAAAAAAAPVENVCISGVYVRLIYIRNRFRCRLLGCLEPWGGWEVSAGLSWEDQESVKLMSAV